MTIEHESGEIEGSQGEAAGGFGGGGAPSGTRLTRMLKRSVEQRWPIDDETRRRVVEHLEAVVRDESAAGRDRVSAAKALIAADRVNLEDERGPATENHLHLHSQGQQVREVMNAIEQCPDFQRWARDRMLGGDAGRFRGLLQSGKLIIGQEAKGHVDGT